jgi:SpoVK/Ycf46/Vps4 family AAA+-type ATPase
VIRSAVAAAAAAPSGTRVQDTIDDYIRQTRDARIGQYARRVTRLAAWSSVVFPPDIVDSLRELIARVRHGRIVFDTWNMSRIMATSRGLTALFQGPPGTGKTLVAGVIARELGLDLYQVDLSKVMSKWIGETERNLSAIFDAAEDGQVVLLFDESDSLFAKRTEVRSSNDRYANLEVNYLLQRLDSFEGIAILTTNNGTSIDQAFKRRMSFRLSFPFPDEETREQLWRAHLPAELPIEGTLALGALARKYQLSGGYIRNACLRAAFLAAQDETSLHQHHLERAVALEFAELGKLSNSGAID